MDKAEKYYTPKEWQVYKNIRDYYKKERMHCRSEYDLVSLTFEMSSLDAAIEFEDCRFILENAIFKNSCKANEAKLRLDALSRSIHGDFVRKYIRKNHTIVAYEIKNLISAMQTEERLRKELEENDYNEKKDHDDACTEFDVLVEDIVNNEGVENSPSELKPEPEPEKAFAMKAKNLKEFIAELNQLL